MGKHRSTKRSVEVRKLKKRSWGVAFHWPNGRDELIDGFETKRKRRPIWPRA